MPDKNIAPYSTSDSQEPTKIAPEKNSFFLSDVTDVLWTLTSQCNLRCAYCGVVDTACDIARNRRFDSLDEKETERILSELSKLPNLESIILSGGEALLSKNFETVLRRTREIASIRYVITNGTVTRHRQLLVDERPRIMVTIDSTDEDVNALTRGPRVLEKALKTVNFLIDSNLFTIVIMVATCQNIGHIPQTLRDLYARGVRNFLIQQLHCPSSESKEMFLELSPTAPQIGKLAEAVDNLRQELGDIQIDDTEVCFFVRRRDKVSEKCDPNQEYLPHNLFACGAAFNFFAIKANADVIPCNAFLDSPAGNLLRVDLVTILERSPLMCGLRNLRLHRVDEIPACRNCDYSPLCDGGCRADVYNLTGEIGDPHPACPHNKLNA